MESSGVTAEVQDYIKGIEEQRSRCRWLSSDVCQQILERAAELKSVALFGLGYYYYAEGYWYQGDNDKAMHCLTECTKYFPVAEMYEYLAKQFEQAFLQQELFGVEMLDIDFFKQYNDTYGHLQGDCCIEAIADILSSVQNDKVFCARYGGDEFMVVYSGMTTGEIRQVAVTIQEKVQALRIPHKNSSCCEYVSVSQGIFVRIPHEENREWDYNSAADKALYEAKEQGRNCYCMKTRF